MSSANQPSVVKCLCREFSSTRRSTRVAADAEGRQNQTMDGHRPRLTPKAITRCEF